MLKSTNEEIQWENLKLKSEILKSNENVKGLHKKVIEHENHLNGIEQYLRVNNLEIVGLPPPEYEGAPSPVNFTKKSSAKTCRGKPCGPRQIIAAEY